MKYRIEEYDGVFTPQFKYFFWWVDFGISYSKKEYALQQIKEHYKYHRIVNNKPTYYYVNEEELI